MALSSLLRLLREGLVVRALLWPGLVTALSLVGSATATIAWRSNPSVASSVPELEPVLREAGFRVVATPDAEADLRSGRVERAVWREQGPGSQRVVLGSTWGGLLTLRLEGALRDTLGERWRLEAASLPRREADNRDLGRVTGTLAAVVGLLFTLYGVAIGAGSLHRDRVGGLLECELAAAVPRGFHAAARLAAVATVLCTALAASLALLDAILPIANVATWGAVGMAAAATGGALGLQRAAASAARGFSTPLSQGIASAMALAGLGYQAPGLGRFLPLLSLGSALAGHDPSWTVAPLTLAAVALATLDFHRREGA